MTDQQQPVAERLRLEWKSSGSAAECRMFGMRLTAYADGYWSLSHDANGSRRDGHSEERGLANAQLAAESAARDLLRPSREAWEQLWEGHE
jgi:hypothetical protein